MKLDGKRMTKAEEWSITLKDQPWTFVLLIGNVTLMPLGMIFAAIGVDDPGKKTLAWCGWSIGALLLFSALLAVWNAERKGTISDAAKRHARLILYIGAWVACIAIGILILWPDVPWGLRVKAGALLCGIITALSFLRPIMRKANHPPQPTPLKQRG